MALIGMLNGIGLWLLGVPVPAALGLITALFTFIPNFGPIMWLVPAALMALTASPILPAYVALLHFGVQFVESYLVTPLVRQRTVSLTPAFTLTVQFVTGVLFGPLGLILAAVALVMAHRLVPWETPASRGGIPSSPGITAANQYRTAKSVSESPSRIASQKKPAVAAIRSM